MAKPEHWDGTLMHVQKGTAHASISPRPNRANKAATETWLATVELACDKLLQRCNTGVAPFEHVHSHVVQRLTGIRRLKLTTKIGCKTFVTRKLYQGVPAWLMMQATGHPTEEAFNHYVGLDELKLVEEFMRK